MEAVVFLQLNRDFSDEKSAIKACAKTWDDDHNSQVKSMIEKDDLFKSWFDYAFYLKLFHALVKFLFRNKQQ